VRADFSGFQPLRATICGFLSYKFCGEELDKGGEGKVSKFPSIHTRKLKYAPGIYKNSMCQIYTFCGKSREDK